MLALAALGGDALLSAVLYPELPERVPVHWNLSGQADRYGSKLELVLFRPLGIAALWVLLLLLCRIDPRRAVRAASAVGDAAPEESDGSYWTVIHLVVALVLLHGGILLAASGLVRGPDRLIAIGLALFLLLPGNLLASGRRGHWPRTRCGVAPTAWRLR